MNVHEVADFLAEANPGAKIEKVELGRYSVHRILIRRTIEVIDEVQVDYDGKILRIETKPARGHALKKSKAASS